MTLLDRLERRLSPFFEWLSEPVGLSKRERQLYRASRSIDRFKAAIVALLLPSMRDGARAITDLVEGFKELGYLPPPDKQA